MIYQVTKLFFAIFDRNVDFWPKFLFLTENFDFWPTPRLLDQNIDVWSKFRCFTKISIIDQNFDFWPKFRFLTKISIFDHNLNFWPKFRFLTKISIFDQNFDFWPKFRFLTNMSIFAQNFDFWPKFRFLTFDQNIFDKIASKSIPKFPWQSVVLVGKCTSRKQYRFQQQQRLSISFPSDHRLVFLRTFLDLLLLGIHQTTEPEFLDPPF